MKVFSDSIPTQLGAVIIRKAVDTTSRTTRKSVRRFLREDFEVEDIIVVTEVLRKRSGKEQALGRRSTSIKRRILTRTDMKRMVNKKINYKVRNISMTNKPPCCPTGLRSSHRSTKSFHIIGREMKELRWTTATRSRNCTSHLCWHIL